jgi:hypothetical protein
MATLQQIKAKGETLAQELAQIRKQIATTRAQLQAAAGNMEQAEQAGKIAGALLVLEAREKSTIAAIEANGREQAQRAELVKTKEYRDAQKRLAELESHFSQEAAEVFEVLTALRERVLGDMQQHDEYCQLLRAYAVDMEPAERDARMRGKDFAYLAATHMILTQRHRQEEHIKNLEAMTAAHAQARKNPKPKAAQVIAKVRQTFYRHTNHDGTPQLDAAGKPVG